MFRGPLEESILKRAQQKKLLTLRVHDLRRWTRDRHRTADDRPFGGGAGMVLKPEPIFAAVESLRKKNSRVLLLGPAGKRLDHARARKLAKHKHLILICGRYEGVDERVRAHLADEEISIGDYVLTGGELAAMVLIDAVSRQIRGVLGHPESAREESFAEGWLEYPQYTRPAVYRGWKVPKILLSGNHAAIAAWRRQQALRRTKKLRPDLLSPSAP